MWVNTFQTIVINQFLTMLSFTISFLKAKEIFIAPLSAHLTLDLTIIQLLTFNYTH